MEVSERVRNLEQALEDVKSKDPTVLGENTLSKFESLAEAAAVPSNDLVLKIREGLQPFVFQSSTGKVHALRRSFGPVAGLSFTRCGVSTDGLHLFPRIDGRTVDCERCLKAMAKTDSSWAKRPNFQGQSWPAVQWGQEGGRGGPWNRG